MPKQLAFNSRTNYAPYLYELPREFRQYKSLWNRLQIQQEYKPEQLETILRGVFEEHKSDELTEELQQVNFM